jgi:uncharacterized protein with GYD domain
VPTYLMLSRLTDSGAHTIKSNPERIREVDRELSAMGVKVVQQYALLGEYDFANILEAPDDITIARASLEMASRGTVRMHTMRAIPAEELIEGLKAQTP